jgi:hypothetical protein
MGSAPLKCSEDGPPRATQVVRRGTVSR